MSANKDNVNFFFFISICISPVTFSCLISLAKLSTMILNRSSESTKLFLKTGCINDYWSFVTF